MADKKISELTAATTPLAGTEELAIVQSGSKKVSVSDLTAGRAISLTEATVTTGNLIIATSGKGVDFSGAGTAANVFDDYEEGTWTPSYQLDGTDFDSVVYDGIRNGTYVKIGREVFCTFAIRTDAITVGSGSGGLLLTGLPYTVRNIASRVQSNALVQELWATAPVCVSPWNNTAFCYIRRASGPTGGLNETSVNTGANSNYLTGQFSYFTD